MIARVLAVMIVLLPGLAAAQELRHPNGLAVTPPPATAVQQTADGFAITDADSAGRRAVSTLGVRLVPGAAPGGAGAETRVIEGRVVRYRLVSSGGGSGGEEHDLTAWFATRGGHVLVEATRQAEWPARPDFALAWRVIADLVARNP